MLITHTNVRTKLQPPETLNDAHQCKENGKPPHDDVPWHSIEFWCPVLWCINKPDVDTSLWYTSQAMAVISALLSLNFVISLDTETCLFLLVISHRSTRFPPMEFLWIHLFLNGLCMHYFWLCMNSILQFFRSFLLCTCALIYDMGFPSSQRHYFQPLWTMWNRLNIHTHPWAQRVQPISNCHRTFIFIPHPECNIQWFLSQMWSILTKHTAIFSRSHFLFDSLYLCTFHLWEDFIYYSVHVQNVLANIKQLPPERREIYKGKKCNNS